MLTKQTLTIASANLFNFIEPPNAFYDFENIYERDAWQDKCRWTTEQIQALAADVIGLQEVFSIEATQALFAQMGYPFFATVETPKVADEYIYSHPVVAIASRYPLKHIQAVTTPNDLISEGYGVEAPPFSRSPVFCIVDVPHIGELGFYVCHLKSQRAAESLIPDKAQPLIGRWLSSQQRGWEALMLRLFSEQQYAQHPMPTVLVGDMNQALSSDISGLLTQPANNEPHKLQFKDSWQLLLDTPQDRPATHYHFSRGHVLDYILLSQEFQPDSVYSLADVTQFTTLDDHLINPSYEQDKNASDHAFIAVTLRFVL